MEAPPPLWDFLATPLIPTSFRIPELDWLLIDSLLNPPIQTYRVSENLDKKVLVLLSVFDG